MGERKLNKVLREPETWSSYKGIAVWEPFVCPKAHYSEQGGFVTKGPMYDPESNSSNVCTVRVFRQKFTLEDAIGSHACSLEANTRVTNGIPLGSPLLVPVHTVTCVQTLKVRCSDGSFLVF
jgi:hypothetical protein